MLRYCSWSIRTVHAGSDQPIDNCVSTQKTTTQTELTECGSKCKLGKQTGKALPKTVILMCLRFDKLQNMTNPCCSHQPRRPGPLLLCCTTKRMYFSKAYGILGFLLCFRLCTRCAPAYFLRCAYDTLTCRPCNVAPLNCIALHTNISISLPMQQNDVPTGAKGKDITHVQSLHVFDAEGVHANTRGLLQKTRFEGSHLSKLGSSRKWT